MTSSYKQPAHKLLTIPGPIEVSDDVLLSNASPSVSHVGPAFSKIMKESLAMLQQVLYTTSAQPFLVAGSGTLGWDMVSSNLVEPGENVLVLHSGYFGDAFADCLEVYGAKVKQIKAPVGAAVTREELEKELKSVGEGHYKLVTFTHCDTSTGVLANAKNMCETVKRLSCQKGLGVPPGLCIVLASQKAMKVLETRKTPVTSYFASWKKWLPIMQAYQSGGAAYFATPPTNLITALHTSLTTITTGSPNLEQRFAAHKAISQKIKKTVQDMGLKLLPLDPEFAANGMTAIWAPDGLKPTDIVPKMLAKDVIVAAGLHKDCKEKYFRIGHMGVTVVDDSRGDVDKILTALKESLTEAGYQAPSSVSA